MRARDRFDVRVRGTADHSVENCVNVSPRVLTDCRIARCIMPFNSVKDLFNLVGGRLDGVAGGVLPFLAFLFLMSLKEVDLLAWP